MDTMMALLLGKDLPEMPTKRFEVKRLSKAFGTRFEVTLKGLGFNMVAELRERNAGAGKDDSDCHLLLEGMVEPSMKNRELLDKLHAATPIDGIKAIFLPGEIEGLAFQVAELSGYGSGNITAIKKN